MYVQQQQQQVEQQQVEYTIIIPSFMAASTLNVSIQYLCQNTVGLWEIILIVDGSWDDSIPVIAQIVTSSICINNIGLQRVRVLYQPTSIYETSSDNIGFTLGNPSPFVY